ncbi:MAG: hypothetical protein H6680_07475 [Desulfobacteraceae bacterium]|nr:hypothetical protein [Desulfobacteraceae bacterium]
MLKVNPSTLYSKMKKNLEFHQKSRQNRSF